MTKQTILIVDDTPTNIQVLAPLLMEHDYEVSAAMSGLEALDMLENFQPDLILLDIMMPGIDGYETCQRIMKMEVMKDVPILFLTAKQNEEDILKGFKVGGKDYICKPFHTEELLARVQTHLELKLERDARIQNEKNLVRTVEELQKALTEVKTLQGLLPVCANCHKILDDEGLWQEIEAYVQSKSDAEFTHTVCPCCIDELYPELKGRMSPPKYR